MATPAVADTNLGTSADITYVTNSTPIGPASSGTVDVSCPAGTHVVGIGGDENSTVAGSHLHSMFPFDSADADSAPDDGVEVAATNADTGFGANPSAYAQCSTSKPMYVMTTTPDPAGRPLVARAHCPAGTHVLGGGARAHGATNLVRISQSHPFDDGDTNTKPDDGWQVVTYNPGSSSQFIDVFAICADRTMTYNVLRFASDNSTSIGISCDPTGVMLSGGVAYTGHARQFTMQTSNSYDGNGSTGGTVPDSAWGIDWLDTQDPTGQHTTFYVICEAP